MKTKISLFFCLFMICSYAGPPAGIEEGTSPVNAAELIVPDEAPSVFVSPSGSDGNQGTLASPVRTINRAIDLAQSSGREFVRVIGGTYSESVNMAGGIHLVGGYGPDGSYNPPAFPVVVNAVHNSSVGKSLALVARNFNSTTYVTDIEFRGQNGNAMQKSAYTIYVNNANLVLQRVKVISGNGAPGQSGAAGQSASQTRAPDGQRGENGDEFLAPCNDDSFARGGSGASYSGSSGNLSGGSGGHGGRMDTDCGFPPDFDATRGLNGLASPFGIQGGSGGGTCASGENGRMGTPGTNGLQGNFGQTRLTGSVLSGLFWNDNLGRGFTGGFGSDGRGGGGGGGAGGCNDGNDSYGAGGGGGGAGGQRAPQPGSGGEAGGSSFGIFAYYSTVRTLDCSITAGRGGNGGAGGAAGLGQPGGFGGEGGTNPKNDRGGQGGDGGRGGNSGAGGHGAGGHSIAVYMYAGTLMSQGTQFTASTVGSGGSGAQSRDVYPSALSTVIEPLLIEQTLTIPPITAVDDCIEDLIFDVTASSGLPVTITTASPNATVTGNAISFTASGEVVLDITQEGNNYFAPVSTSVTLEVNCIQSQTISFEPIGTKTYGDAPFEVLATASSGLPVTLAVVSGPAQLEGTMLTISGAGDVTLSAAQEGNEFFEAAPLVTQTFIVLKADQVIDFPVVADHTLGDAPVTVNATSSAGLPVTYFASGPGVMIGSTVALMGPGTISVIATQGGNEFYHAATSVVQTFMVHDANGSLISVWFADVDGDGFGDGNSALASCLPIAGYVQNSQDCNDAHANIQPGSTEIEDGIDNNCDGQIDEGFGSPPVDDITVTAVCAENPNKNRRWEIHNPNAFSVALEWEIIGTTEKSWIDLQPGNSYLITNTIKKNLNILRAHWHNEKGIRESLEITSIVVKCEKQNGNARVLTGENTQDTYTSALNVFPNPASSTITIAVASKADIETTLQMVTPTGVIQEDTPVQLGNGANYLTRDISGLPRGVYLIKVGRQSVRFIKD